MPLTKLGKKVKGEFAKKYGDKGESVFYASMNKGTIDRSKMEGKKRKR